MKVVKRTDPFSLDNFLRLIAVCRKSCAILLVVHVNIILNASNFVLFDPCQRFNRFCTKVLINLCRQNRRILAVSKRKAIASKAGSEVAGHIDADSGSGGAGVAEFSGSDLREEAALLERERDLGDMAMVRQ